MSPGIFGCMSCIQSFLDVSRRRTSDFAKGLAINRAAIDKVLSIDRCNPFSTDEIFVSSMYTMRAENS